MPNVRVEMREAKRVDMSRRWVVMSQGDDLPYDMLVIATGAQTSYFGHELEWAPHALGLKTLSDAVTARNRLLTAFEGAGMEADPGKQARDMTVVVVGGGPTGVAITGTISEFGGWNLPSQKLGKNCPRKAKSKSTHTGFSAAWIRVRFRRISVTNS